MAGAGFSFPTNLSNDELQQCLADMQIHLDVTHLTKPTYEVVRQYFEQAVIALTGVSRCGPLAFVQAASERAAF
jgi:kinetochore protein Nuf2